MHPEHLCKTCCAYVPHLTLCLSLSHSPCIIAARKDAPFVLLMSSGSDKHLSKAVVYVVQEVDPVFAQSCLHLMQLSSSAVDVDADIAALDLDFTIPGCPEAEMKVSMQFTFTDRCYSVVTYCCYCHGDCVFQPGGKDIQVTSQNIKEYLQVRFWTGQVAHDTKVVIACM